MKKLSSAIAAIAIAGIFEFAAANDTNNNKSVQIFKADRVLNDTIPGKTPNPSPTPAPAPMPSPSPAPAPTPSPTPSPTPTPTPSPTPAPTPPSPTPTPNPGPPSHQ